MTNQMAMLLYLRPEEALHLIEIVERLQSFICIDEKSKVELSLIRKDLFICIYPLSPLSKTKKMVHRILKFSEKCPPFQQEAVEQLTAEFKQIYKST